MSSLSCLLDYGSYSEESDSDNNSVETKKKLPLPDLSNVITIVTEEDHEDDPDLHCGRIRSFPHVRGNWSTFVYLQYSPDSLCELVSKLYKEVLIIENTCKLCDDLHISLSKTVVLKYHQISTFTDHLRRSLSRIESFPLEFDSVNVYTNEDKSRTFLSLEVDYYCTKNLKEITTKIDNTLKDFRLPVFYDEPSFHMSVLWINGDKQSEVENILDKLNNIVAQEIGKSLKIVNISTVLCKSGNKTFQFHLL